MDEIWSLLKLPSLQIIYYSSCSLLHRDKLTVFTSFSYITVSQELNMYLNFFTAAACIFAVTHLHCHVTKNFLPENRFRAFIAIPCFCDISELTLCLK